MITPWNYALSLAAMDVVPALAAGCAVVQKADDQGALTILALRRAFIDAGVPEAVWAVVAGPASEVGEALTDQVDYICFTGSTATGRKIAEKAGRRLVGASLELGGKNAMIVLDDVDPEQAAADAAYACFSAMGQLCVSIERIYVQRKVAGPFTAALVERLRSADLGSSLDYGSDFGSLASAAQLERIEGHLDDAVAKGAEVLVGRPRPPRRSAPGSSSPRCSPASRREMRAYAEETFGAVASLYLVDSEEEAILAANASEYGLNASVLTALPAPRPPRRRRARGRQRQRQRGLPRHLRVGRRSDGRREGVGPRSAQRTRGPAAVRRSRHRVDGDRAHPAAAHRQGLRRDGRAVPAARAGAAGDPAPLTGVRSRPARDGESTPGCASAQRRRTAQVASESNGAGSPAPSASRLRLRCR